MSDFFLTEEIRQEVEEEIRKKPSQRKRELVDDTEIEETLKVLQQMAPEEDQKQEQELIKQAMEVEKAVDPNEPPPMVCPFHIELLVNVPNRKGYQLMKCPEQPCLISIFDQNNKQAYMARAAL